MLTNISSFFTFWVAILCIFYDHTNKYIDLTFLSIIVLVIGSYISFVNPRKYTLIIQDQEYLFNGLYRFISIDILHIMLFLLIVNRYQRPTIMTFVNAMVLTLSYFILFDVETIYKTSKNIVILLFSLITIIYTVYLYLVLK